MTENRPPQEATKETPEQTIVRAQEIIDTLREHLQNATDALVAQQVENKLMARHLHGLEMQMHALEEKVAEFTNDEKDEGGTDD